MPQQPFSLFGAFCLFLQSKDDQNTENIENDFEALAKSTQQFPWQHKLQLKPINGKWPCRLVPWMWSFRNALKSWYLELCMSLQVLNLCNLCKWNVKIGVFLRQSFISNSQSEKCKDAKIYQDMPWCVITHTPRWDEFQFFGFGIWKPTALVSFDTIGAAHWRSRCTRCWCRCKWPCKRLFQSHVNLGEMQSMAKGARTFPGLTRHPNVKLFVVTDLWRSQMFTCRSPTSQWWKCRGRDFEM